jgi:hypothetical protein
MGNKGVHCEVFPIGLVMPGGHKEDPDACMKTDLNDSVFKAEIAGITAQSYRATMVNLRSAVYSLPNMSWALI